MCEDQDEYCHDDEIAGKPGEDIVQVWGNPPGDPGQLQRIEYCNPEDCHRREPRHPDGQQERAFDCMDRTTLQAAGKPPTFPTILI
jgi:hypothetical protein